MKLLAVVAHLGYTFGIGNLVAEPLVEISHHALVDMAHRQPAEGPRPGLARTLLDFLHVHDKPPMGQHDALGNTRGARGVDHRADIVGGQRVLHLLQPLRRIGMLLQVATANLVDIIQTLRPLHGHYGTEILQLGQILADTVDPLAQCWRLHHQQSHLGIIKDVEVVFLAHRRVDGQEHGSRLLHTEVDVVPLRASGTDKADVLAFLHSQVHQSVADQIGFLDVFIDVVVLPLAVFLVLEYRAFRVQFFPPLQQVKKSCGFVHSVMDIV